MPSSVNLSGKRGDETSSPGRLSGKNNYGTSTDAGTSSTLGPTDSSLDRGYRGFRLRNVTVFHVLRNK